MQSTPSEKTAYKKLNLRLVLVIGFLALVLVGSLIAMWFISKNGDGRLVAYVYQDGELIHEIPLDLVTEPYTIEIYGDQANGPFNQIEVRHGSIGMVDASCPDKLCVHMGFQDSAMVPITCLPNKVVIQLRLAGKAGNTDTNSKTDIIIDGISH